MVDLKKILHSTLKFSFFFEMFFIKKTSALLYLHLCQCVLSQLRDPYISASMCPGMFKMFFGRFVSPINNVWLYTYSSFNSVTNLNLMRNKANFVDEGKCLLLFELCFSYTLEIHINHRTYTSIIVKCFIF